MLTSSSFKLQKLTKSMQFRSDSFSKDSTLNTPRLAAMNSVTKSVKYNNLSFMTGQQICKLRREPEQSIQDPQYSVAHNNMSNIRKRYDKTNQQKLYLQNKIDRLTEEANKYKEIQKQFQDNKKDGKHKVTNLCSQLQNIKLLLQDKYYQKLSYQQMADSITHDKIVYDKRKFDMEKYFKHLQFKVKTIKEQSIHINQEDDRVLKVYQKLIDRLDSQNNQRQEHINSMQTRIIQKQSINNSTVLRKSQMGLIAQQALTDRDPHQKQWIKVFLTHKMLQKMLKSKIQRQMQKFSIVEEAFKNIKIATGVSDASTMVKKFLSKQQIYGDLLSKITQNQKQILALKKQQQNYQKQIKKCEQQLNLMEFNKIANQNLRQELKQAQYIEEKRQRCQLKQKKMRQFLFKLQKQLKQNSINEQNVQQTKIISQDKQSSPFDLRTKDQMKNRFIEYLTNLSVLVDDSLKIPSNQNQNNILQIVNDEQIMKKLLRVKPEVQNKIPHNTSAKQSMISQNSFLQNYQEEEITTKYEQQYTLEEQRVNVLKSNQKFMKQLKNKREQQKRLLVQTLVKNNKQKAAPVPVKKVQAPVQ